MENGGEKIKELMELNKISAYELAAELGITAPGVYNILKRKNINKLQFDSIVSVINNKKVKKLYIENKDEIPQNKVQEAEIEYKKKESTLDIMATALSRAVDALTEENKFLRKENSYANEIIRTFITNKLTINTELK